MFISPDTETSPSKVAFPITVTVPPICALPPIVALLTDILPVITAGTFVKFAPSPKKAEAHTLELTCTSPLTVTLPPNDTLPATSSVPPILVLPATVAVPPIFILPDTDTSSSNSALPVILDVPPTEILLAIVNVLAKLTAPFTLNVLFKCVAASIVAVEDTFNVPPTCAFETDILPVIGIPVIFVPSP